MKPNAQIKIDNNEIAELLRDKGLKVTEQRTAIVALLISEHGPFTVEEISKKLSDDPFSTKINQVTLYRCLEKFEQLGIVQRCDFGDGFSRYELGDLHSKAHHHHIICTRCRRVDHIAVCPIGDIKIPSNVLGYIDVTHRLEFFGICKRCNRAKN